VGSRRALLGADHRGRVWEPFEGSHQDVAFFNLNGYVSLVYFATTLVEVLLS
jgi:hypothetical protein